MGKIYVECQEPVIMERHKSYFFKQTSVSFMLLETIVHTIHINQSEFWNMKKQRFWIMTLIRICTHIHMPRHNHPHTLTHKKYSNKWI